jgi:hypothetical protein
VVSWREEIPAELADSRDMEPVEGTIEVAIPVGTLWDLFARADLWPRWNRCFYWARNHDLVAGQNLVWCFQPIRWWYVYKMPAVAGIVEAEPRRWATWHVTALPGFFARHTYHVEDLGGGRTRFGSWEQAMGPELRLTRRFWLAHFRFVRDRSLDRIYRREGALEPSLLPGRPIW